ncbi:tetratricopeptide repeat protein [Paenibacillus herberti]|uniref:Uncharacterized protein n=1 Tax=Paenibacillus herberti TaxID=1619309 RepID=A0A229P2T2_9BACL|nr:hypothetical protein [Paenibacillus herberti]OXM16606.1 hypothetical protein CGZ75_08075 [Paenibacillus herberti]
MFEPMFAVMNEMLDDIMLRCPGCSPGEREQLLGQLIQLRGISDQFIDEWLVFEEKLVDFQDAFPTEAAAAGLGGVAAIHKGLSGAHAPQPTGQPGRLAKAKLPLMMEPPSLKRPTSSPVAKPSQQDSLPIAKEAAPKGEIPLPVNAAALSFDTEENMMRKIACGQGYFKLFMFPQAVLEFQAAIDLMPECNLARLYLAMSFMHTQQWNDAELHFKLLATLTEHPRWQAISFNALGCIQAIRLNMEQAERLFRQAVKMDPSFEDPVTNLKSCHQAPGPLSLYFGSAELI